VAAAGERLVWSAAASSDPDGGTLTCEWIPYPEAGTWRGPVTYEADGPRLAVTLPEVRSPESLHFVVRVSDDGEPPLSRYARVVITALPRDLAGTGVPRGSPIETAFRPPPEFAGDLGGLASPLRYADGRPVTTPAEWAERRREILAAWEVEMGSWPERIDPPRLDVLTRERREGFEQRRIRVEIAESRTTEGWLLVPDGQGPFPAILVPYYEPDTSIGRGQPRRDFALQLTRRGFVTLSIGSPGGDARRPDTGAARCQPLSYLAYVAANCATALAALPEVDSRRLGIVGHSYGGKWAMFAACLDDRFAAAAWSDPGIVWDETRPNVNYWDDWYLGREEGRERRPGVPSPDQPRTGAYRRLVEGGHDLHELQALMAPRPFLVSGGSEDPPERWRALNHSVAVNALLGRTNWVAMTHRPGHDPTAESNEQVYAFFEHFLGRGAAATGR
jgi:hypothetical protein